MSDRARDEKKAMTSKSESMASIAEIEAGDYKGCPFCGTYAVHAPGSGGYYFHHKPACFLSGRHGSTLVPYGEFSAWNTRAQPTNTFAHVDPPGQAERYPSQESIEILWAKHYTDSRSILAAVRSTVHDAVDWALQSRPSPIDVKTREMP